MPLPTDEKILALSNAILLKFEALFGAHPGFRPAHAKGIMLNGSFTATAEAAKLSRAPHLNRPSTPATVRFSNSTGIPVIPDNDPNADPRGCAVRFHLADRVHTDIVAHSTNGFPSRTGQDFLEFLSAIAATDLAQIPGSPLEKYLGTHPAALAFVQAPKPLPSSFARETYFGLTAVRFINKNGSTRYGRFRLLPEAGNEPLEAAAAAATGPNYLFDEIEQRIAKEPVRFRVVAQLAEDGDTVDDVTVQWPDNRKLLELGKLSFTEPVLDEAHEQKQIIFDPIPRVDGIDASDDPLLELRAAVYLLSGRRRRSAPELG
ncbi:MAG TPA: catalase family peroxidase [Acidobacteriaceae bacterium]|nr:catalase family peroxidase [Acidobacteriaceae bacterium]